MFKYFNVEVSTLRTAYRSVFVGFFGFFFEGGEGGIIVDGTLFLISFSA